MAACEERPARVAHLRGERDHTRVRLDALHDALEVVIDALETRLLVRERPPGKPAATRASPRPSPPDACRGTAGTMLGGNYWEVFVGRIEKRLGPIKGQFSSILPRIRPDYTGLSRTKRD